MIQNDTAVKLKNLMDQKGWSLYRLSVEADIPYSSVNNLFKRNTEPTLPTLRALCRGLGVSLSDFFADEPEVELTDYTAEEKNIIAEYRTLPRASKRLLTSYLAALQGTLPEN